ncbi:MULTISPECIES: hypothetical protein [unclassified Nostoc]|uniref:hypothetical protein n=1 Tax=unclassified Nostoc TaxID=2593658 RepID=UPI0026205A40|nr:hypothetical protein [Nostoc sp. S13]MDF5739007.1 hypothetical protein [Nostoc sp. S13]
MPNFPTADCEIPETLNPLNLRHYLLLIYWIYFRPTALKCYLYQADPELYRSGSRLSILRTLFIFTYRSLYFTALCVSVLLWLSATSVTVNLSIIFGVFSLLALVSMLGGVIHSLLFGVVRGVLFSVVLGVRLSVVFSLAFAAFSLRSVISNNELFGAAFSLGFGLGFGLAFSAVGGVGGLIAVDVAFIMLIGLVCVSILPLGNKVAFGVGFIAGALRVIFYLFEIGLALRSVYRNKKHPIEWDELIVLPLPGTQRLLSQRLQEDELKGLRFASNVARNPFQRWIVQRSLHIYLHNHPTPLHFLYGLLSSPELNTYISIPVNKKDWETLPTSGQLLLGEIAGKCVNCRTGWANQLAERLIWSLTWFCRQRRQTSLTVFASMLCAKNFSLSNYRKAYTNLASYPGGSEITNSFEALAIFLKYDNLLSLPAAVEIASGLTPNDTSIRPTVLAAIARLGEVAANIAIYQTANSDVKQISALRCATNSLLDLDKYIIAEVAMPEHLLLRQVTHNWYWLVEKASRNQNLNRSLPNSGSQIPQRLNLRFPNYRGRIPQCLNPLNIRHYFLLAYWVYFRPTALNCYLYQANSDIYQSRGFGKIFRTWRIAAYRRSRSASHSQ